jgi:N-formylmaleamate deformylase
MAIQFVPQTIAANGAEFNYYRVPAPDGSGKPALVLQHGFSDNGLCWAPVAAELAAAYDLILPDARGHGRSARVARGQVIDQAGDLAGLVSALGVQKAVFAGHSMGAQIVLELAARYPDLAAAIVLEDGGFFAPRPEGSTMEDSPLGQWILDLKDKSLEEILAECREEHPAWPDAYAVPWCQAKKELDPNFLAAHNRHGSWQDLVPAVRCPVLLITADPSQGGLVTPDTARMAKEMNPNIREVNFPGVGHHVRFAVHDAYLRALKAFLYEAAA